MSYHLPFMFLTLAPYYLFRNYPTLSFSVRKTPASLFCALENVCLDDLHHIQLWSYAAFIFVYLPSSIVFQLYYFWWFNSVSSFIPQYGNMHYYAFLFAWTTCCRGSWTSYQEFSCRYVNKQHWSLHLILMFKLYPRQDKATNLSQYMLLLWASSLADRALAYCAKDHGSGPT